MKLQRLIRTCALAAALAAAAGPCCAEKGLSGNHLAWLSDAELARTVSDYRALGVRWVRVEFDWSEIQPRRKGYVTATHDRIVKALGAAGIKVLGLITYTPAWANGGQASKFHPPVDARTYARFCEFLATRYSALGVRAWEIWNEPNLAQFWGPAPDPRAYTALLKLAYAAIKRADRGATVVSGGLAQPGNSATSMESLDFLALMYGSGAAGSFDAVGNHPYTAPAKPSDASAYNWRKMSATLPSFRSLMDEHGDGAKKIWITEYGAPTYGVSGYNLAVSEDEQAATLAQAMQEGATQAWSGPVFWYNYRDYCPYAEGRSTECYYGIRRSDGSAKPAYAAFAAAP